MDTQAVLFLVLAIALPTLSVPADYQPIKITVVENFNNRPGQLAQGIPSLAPSVLHQGANFFFNPQVQLPLGLLPPHIEALATYAHKANESIITVPISEPVEVIVEDEKPIVPILINDGPICEEIVETVAPVENLIGLVNIPEPIPIWENDVPVIEEEVLIPQAPILPPLMVDIVPPMIIEEVDIKESAHIVLPCAFDVEIPEPKPLEVIIEPSIIKETLDTIKITELPAPKPVEWFVELPKPQPVEVIVEENFNSPELEIIKPVIEKEVIIPEAPVLPPMTIDFLTPVITEEISVKEPCDIKVELPLEVAIKEEETFMPVGFLENDEVVIKETITIPEAPILPPLTLNLVPSIILEEVKIQEPRFEIAKETINLKESIETASIISEIPQTPCLLEPIIVPEVKETFNALEESLSLNSYYKDIASLGAYMPSVIISKPQNVFVDVFNPKPIVAHQGLNEINPILMRSGRPAAVVPLPESNIILDSELKENKKLVYSTSLAQNIVAERIVPNIIRGQHPKFIELISDPRIAQK